MAEGLSPCSLQRPHRRELDASGETARALTYPFHSAVGLHGQCSALFSPVCGLCAECNPGWHHSPGSTVLASPSPVVCRRVNDGIHALLFFKYIYSASSLRHRNPSSVTCREPLGKGTSVETDSSGFQGPQKGWRGLSGVTDGLSE